MVYDEITSIKARIELTDIFPSGNIHDGSEFEFNPDRAPYCIIKSGGGTLSAKHHLNGLIHIMAWLRADQGENIEQMLDTALVSVTEEVKKIRNVRPIAFTTDMDIFEPFGVAINPVPPFGGFRLDVEIDKAI